MQKTLSKIFEYLLDLLFPIHCLGCGKNREDLPAKERWICPECLVKIPLRKEQVCPFCEKESEGGSVHFACRDKISLDGLWAAAYYGGMVEEAIHNFKFKFIKYISCPISELIARSILEAEEFGNFQDLLMIGSSKEEEEGIYLDENKNGKQETVIIPVPLHRRRYAWRGFNQSYLLAKEIGAKFGVAVQEDVLIRSKNTKPQSKTKNEDERRKNISGAFSCSSPEKVKNKNIILVDDICTTSATLNECAKELKRAGAKNVWGLVVARR